MNWRESLVSSAAREGFDVIPQKNMGNISTACQNMTEKLKKSKTSITKLMMQTPSPLPKRN